jgi:limonene-1,2-epoxide hydrolase
MNRPVQIVESFLESISARDIDAVLAHFAADATWQNVPHLRVVGRPNIGAMLGPILARSTEVQWDIVSASYGDDRAWLERVDRFWIDGVEYSVRCNGVFEIDTDACLITEVRDYVDLGEWRARLVAAGPMSS